LAFGLRLRHPDHGADAKQYATLRLIDGAPTAQYRGEHADKARDSNDNNSSVHPISPGMDWACVTGCDISHFVARSSGLVQQA
jgi:hypothetical protein